MDYSLLLGVEHRDHLGLNSSGYFDLQETDSEYDSRSTDAHFFEGSKYVVRIAIIDYLQEWNLKKKIEFAGKCAIGKDPDGLSCIAPDEYAARFKGFVN